MWLKNKSCRSIIKVVKPLNTLVIINCSMVDTRGPLLFWRALAAQRKLTQQQDDYRLDCIQTQADRRRRRRRCQSPAYNDLKLLLADWLQACFRLQSSKFICFDLGETLEVVSLLYSI